MTHEIKFYRNSNEDVIAKCMCGWNQVVAEKLPAIDDLNDNLMRSLIKEHEQAA